jgi:hypothetical protein
LAAVEDDSARARRLLSEFVARVRHVDDLDHLDATATAVLAAFNRAGVAALLLKGPVLARVLYTREERRNYGDVDILVEPSALGRAREVLREGGWVCVQERLGVEDVGGGLHGETWIAGDVVVDLHWRLAVTEAPAQAAWNALYARHQLIDLAGHRVATLDRSGLALHVATHAAQHGSRHPPGLRDLELALARWPPEVWSDAAGLAREVGATAAFAAGLHLARAGRELARTLDLAEASQSNWAPLHEWPRGTYHLTAFAEAGSFAARARVVQRALVPPPRWILWEHPWARRALPLLIPAYGAHLMRSPVWAARALRFYRRRAKSPD